MKAREKILIVGCLVLVFFAVQALTSSPLAPSEESESVSPLGTEGPSNTFYGQGAGAVTTGIADTFIGYWAGHLNTTGQDNTFLGRVAGYTNTTGNYNSFIGSAAGFSNTTGYNNSFIGCQSGLNNTTGSSNSFLGYQAGFSNTTGDRNSFLGTGAGYFNTTGSSNSFVGSYAGQFNTTGEYNSFLGSHAGTSNTTGSSNIFLGSAAGHFNTTGYSNNFLGYMAGYFNATGSGNVFLGSMAGHNEAGSNRLYIDNSDTSSPLIYGEFDNNKLTINGNLEVIGPDNGLVRLSNVTTNSINKLARMVVRHYNNAEEPLYLFGAASTLNDNFVAFGGGATIGNAATQIDLYTAPNTTTLAGTPRITVKGNGYVGIGTQFPAAPLQMAGGAYTNGTGWFNASSREYKENVKELKVEDAVEALRGLNPVTFNYKAAADEGHVGFIAEEVPELVATKDRKGLSPMDIVAVLTKVVQELKAENEGLKAKNESLENRLLVIEGKITASK